MPNWGVPAEYVITLVDRGVIPTIHMKGGFMVLFFRSGTGFTIPSSNRVARRNEGVLTDLPLNSRRSAIDVMGCPSLQTGHYSVQIYS